MALALEVHDDPQDAAAFAGFGGLDAAAARQLELEARELFPEGADRAALSALGRATVGRILLHLFRSAELLKPDFAGTSAKAVVQLMQILNSDEDSPASGDISINLTGADGKTLSLVRPPTPKKSGGEGEGVAPA